MSWLDPPWSELPTRSHTKQPPKADLGFVKYISANDYIQEVPLPRTPSNKSGAADYRSTDDVPTLTRPGLEVSSSPGVDAMKGVNFDNSFSLQQRNRRVHTRDLEERIKELEGKVHSLAVHEMTPHADEQENLDADNPSVNTGFKLWGTVVIPTDKDTFFHFCERFCGGQTTAHGICRVFDDDIGIIRRIFWLVAFALGLYCVSFYADLIVSDYLFKGTAAGMSEGSHQGALPALSVCSVSPIQCSCEAFYDPTLLEDPHFDKVIPYLCREVLVYQSASPDRLDPNTGKPLQFTTLERSVDFVDKSKTKANILSGVFKQTIECGDTSVGITKGWFIQKIIANTLTKTDLYLYAGFTKRSQMIKDCTVVDSAVGSGTFGKAISCMDDTWWGPSFIDDRYGVCNVFNPCLGFPVGHRCQNDADCDHPLNQDALSKEAVPLPDFARVQGGYCNNAGTCACRACIAGKDCNVGRQLKPGKGRGARIVYNAAVLVDSALSSAQNAQLYPGVLVHIHSHYNRGLLQQEGITLQPGQVVDISLRKVVYVDEEYPYTNCSTSFNIDPDLCRVNCLQYMQAITCCKAAKSEVPAVMRGKFTKNITYHQLPSKMIVDNPAIAHPGCSMLDAEVTNCTANLQEKFNMGEICLDGSYGIPTKFFNFLFLASSSKPNSYFDRLEDGGISYQESVSSAVQKHCVWSEKQLANGFEARLGSTCETDYNCRTSRGKEGVDGKCVQASRAFCPPRCVRDKYIIPQRVSAIMSEATASVLAARELATTTSAHNITGASTKTKKFRPMCQAGTLDAPYDPTDECFTVTESVNYVTQNYGILNLEYTDFTELTTERSSAADLGMALGAVGGNMGLFCGFSAMTIIEWLEFLFFFVFGLPIFLLGTNLFPCFVRRVQKDD